MNRILTEARECWESLSAFRRKRNRCRDYTFGRQWNDIIEINGRRMTEYEYIISEGNIPLKNNLIRRIVRNVIGVFRKDFSTKIKELPSELSATFKENSLEELYCRTLEEFLISGVAIHRKHFGIQNGKPGLHTDIVSPSSFFYNTSSRDFRGNDIDLIGQLHEVSLREWCSFFVNDPESYRKAKILFGNGNRKVRITEVWKREERPGYLIHDKQQGRLLRRDPESVSAEHLDMPYRWTLEDTWRFYFLTDNGDVILEGDSPYIHGSHPFVFKGYPFLDGEIHSLVADMIDQQRYTNRLITLYDWVIRASAKGVLLLPEGAVEPEDLQNVADQWGRFNGVIVYKATNGNPPPQQVSGNATNIGIGELLDIQLKMFEDVSGVNGALRGNLSSNTTSGTLYNQQTENAMNSLNDLFGTFYTFIDECTRMDLSLLRQTTDYKREIFQCQAS